jgi:hypothetical protein
MFDVSVDIDEQNIEMLMKDLVWSENSLSISS